MLSPRSAGLLIQLVAIRSVTLIVVVGFLEHRLGNAVKITLPGKGDTSSVGLIIVIYDAKLTERLQSSPSNKTTGVGMC